MQNMNMKDHMKLDVMLMFKGPEMILISNKLIRLSYLLTELRIALVIKNYIYQNWKQNREI